MLPNRLSICIGFAVFLLFSSTLVHAAEKIILYVHPYKTASKIYKAFTPLVKYLSKKTQQPVEIYIAKNYDKHITEFANSKSGIAYMGPASYVKLVSQFGKRRILARQAINGDPTFKGKIIASKNSKITSLKDLIDKRFAFGDPNSTMSHLVPRYMLIKAGITSDLLADHQFLGNHINVALGVLGGRFDAGAVKEAVYWKYKDRGLRELATTPALSEHLFITSDDLSDDKVNILRDALFNMDKNPEGLKALHAIKKSISAMVPAKDSDYDNLRNILNTLKEHNVIQ